MERSMHTEFRKLNREDVIGTFSEMLKAGYEYGGTFCRQMGADFNIHIFMVERHKGKITCLVHGVGESRIQISLQGIVPIARLFEREIQDLFGLAIGSQDSNQHIDDRPLVRHESWESGVHPLLKDFDESQKIKMTHGIPRYEYRGISGTGGLQIPVGPVHAGVIEPGHFRFTIGGEPIENLEIRLMYKHRGIEKRAENMEANILNLLFERVAGESSVAYAQAYAMLVEQLSPLESNMNIDMLRTILLELERIYNFMDDMAGICVDIGYSYPAKRYQMYSELTRQCCEKLTGSRYMRNAIVPGGMSMEWNQTKKEALKSLMADIEKGLHEVYLMTVESVSFLDRVEHTGMVSRKEAKETHMTGVVGRACGIPYDVRKSFPYAAYSIIDANDMSPLTSELGGVYERYQLKYEEVRRAMGIICKLVERLPEHLDVSKPAIILREDSEAVVAVETVKGELLVYGAVGKDNHFDRIYFKTPSFTAWEGLTYAVLGEIVPDFPLCNKSFNMSYSENDR